MPVPGVRLFVGRAVAQILASRRNMSHTHVSLAYRPLQRRGQEGLGGSLTADAVSSWVLSCLSRLGERRQNDGVRRETSQVSWPVGTQCRRVEQNDRCAQHGFSLDVSGPAAVFSELFATLQIRFPCAGVRIPFPHANVRIPFPCASVHTPLAQATNCIPCPSASVRMPLPRRAAKGDKGAGADIRVPGIGAGIRGLGMLAGGTGLRTLARGIWIRMLARRNGL